MEIGYIASQWPNKWAMILKEDGEIESGTKEEDTMPHLEEDNEVEHPVDGKILVTRQALSMKIKEDEE